jgi:glucose-1-phosphate cytidylyltransferase
MKIVLLAGGTGTRLSEETSLRPKPMVEIGGKPILWHIMKIYSFYGFNDFIICLGYKGYMIKEYFINYFYHQSDLTIDLKKNKTTIHSSKSEPWTITLVDTGIDTLTGGRIKRIEQYINNETFMLTYGDGVSDVNLKELEMYHKINGKYATLTSVQPSGRFGSLILDENDKVSAFQEKLKGDGAWINGGFFVLEPNIFKYIKDDLTIWEREPLENLAKDGQLTAYKHKGFWKPMDTLRDKIELEEMWNNKLSKWKLWD